MMDFEKIKPAVEEIKLSDSQKEDILNACKNRKRKFNYKPIAAVAAAAVIVFIVFSPGFLIRAGKSDSSEAEAGNINDACQEDYMLYDSEISGELFSLTDSEILFESGEYRRIYSLIPAEFYSLVDSEDYKEWKATVTKDKGMAISQFVDFFEISEDVFEEANKKYGRRVYRTLGEIPVILPADYEGQEEFEIFNTEIIFGHDREKINEYYLKPDYENADSSAQHAVTAAPEYYE